MGVDVPTDKQSIDYVKYIAALPVAQVEKIERVCAAVEKQFHAEANKEAHQKIRILFERAAKEWLPFIVYCLTFAPVATIAIYKISSMTTWWALLISWIGLLLLMILPILFVPKLRGLLSGEESPSPLAVVMDKLSK